MSASADGYLTISGLSQEPTQWVETESLVFRQVGGQETIAFRADAQGQITYLFKGNLPINGFRKLALYEAIPFHYGLLAACVGLFLSALLILFVVSIQDLALFPTSLTKVALGLALVAAALSVAAVAGTALAWRRCYWGVVGRVHYTLVTLGAVAFVWFLNDWNLLGFRF